MKKLTSKDVKVPASVPKTKEKEYVKNFLDLTHGTGNLMIFAGDQKIEHLNDDFYGMADTGPIALDDADPEHLFKIANAGIISCLAVQPGLAASYGKDYPKVNLLIKMNSKSPLVKSEQKDPLSGSLIGFEKILNLKKQLPNIKAIGYTIYLGSEFENEMLAEASRLIFNAHEAGLLAVLWIYPRGKAVKDEKDAHLIAGACGIACCLGADFVKVNYPKKEGERSEEIFKEAVMAAGRTGVVCAGGSSTDARKFLEKLYSQINVSGARGNATGRNIHQKPLDEAVRMCDAIAAITFAGEDVDMAMKVYESGKSSAGLKKLAKD